jgi:hypothetical protein
MAAHALPTHVRTHTNLHTQHLLYGNVLEINVNCTRFTQW